MNCYTLRYEFSQQFEVPARDAFDWCTDYRADDWMRMGKKGTRRVARLNDDTLILTDTVQEVDGAVTKRRLVRLLPRRLAWTNTHLTGPNRHSQFWYRIVSEGRLRSRLEFTGLQVNYGPSPTAARAARMAQALRDDDAGMWALLAEEMSKDPGRPRAPSRRARKT
jgi:hypothetical protein